MIGDGMQIVVLTPLCGAINAKPNDVVDVAEGLAQSLIAAGYAAITEVKAEEVEKPKVARKRSANKGAV